MSGGEQKQRKTQILNFFGIYMFVVLITFGVVITIYKIERNNELYSMLQVEESLVSHSKQTTELEATEVISDLFLILSQSNFIDFINTDNPDLKQKIAEDMKVMSFFRKKYDQIRYIDNKGMETVRVNYNQGQPSIVPDVELQSKTNRYYFDDTLILDKNEIFISPLDLNIENELIESPYKPMIRVGTPVFDAQGEKKGILLLNYSAKIILDRLLINYEQGNGELMILNENGYWLMSEDPALEFGFMFEDKQDIVFKNYQPDVWQQIENEKDGQFINKDGVYTFNTLKPVEGQNFTFIIISFVPNSIVYSQSNLLLKTLILFTSILLLLLGVVTWFLARAVARRRIAEKQALELNDILKIINKILRHDIKNKLTGIKLSLETFQADGDKEMLKIAEGSAKSGIDLVTKMKELEGLVSSGGQLKKTNVRELALKMKKEHKIPIKIKGQLTIMADDALCSVCDNLVRNAVIHGKTKKIDIVLFEDKQRKEIRFIDYGKGIPDNIKKDLFQEGHAFGATGNTGLGLYIIKKTIERYGGNVRIEDTKPRGATFVITLPK